jgi:hypothetical protein
MPKYSSDREKWRLQKRAQRANQANNQQQAAPQEEDDDGSSFWTG